MSSTTKPKIVRKGGRPGGPVSSSSSGPPPIPPPMSTSNPSPDLSDDEGGQRDIIEPVPIPVSRVPAGSKGSARITPGAKKSARIPVGGSSTSSTKVGSAKVGSSKAGPPPIPSKAPPTPPSKSPSVKSPSIKSPSIKSPSVKSPSIKSPSIKSPSIKSPSIKGKSPMTNVYITDGSSIPVDTWVGDIQAKVNEMISYIEPDQKKRNRYIDNEAMKIWTKAFTHETANYNDNNKTLETFGDAVLRLYFINYLMQKFPNLGQSGYTNLINHYQDRVRQGNMSSKYGLYDLININPKSIRDDKLAGDIYEAFFGALFRVGDLVLPGLGGVLANNLIVYLYNQEDVDINRTQKDPKSAVTQMFNRFRFGDEAKTNYYKAIRDASLIEQNTNGTYTYVLILPAAVNQFLLQHNIDVDPTKEYTGKNGNVTLGEGTSRDSKEANIEAYKLAYDVLRDSGFTPETAEDIKRDMDFGGLDSGLVQKAEAKARQQNIKLLFGTPSGEVSTVQLKGRLVIGDDIVLASYSYGVGETITSARERVLQMYIDM